MSTQTIGQRTPSSFLFNSTISTQRRTITFDSGNAPVETWNAYLSGIAAMVQPKGGMNFDPLANRKVYEDAITVYVSPDLDIIATDRIVFGGKTYQQNPTPSNQINAGVITRLDCTQVVEEAP